MKRIRVLLADVPPHLGDRLRALLAQQPDIDIVGGAPDGGDLSQALLTHRPDVVLLDAQTAGKLFELLALVRGLQRPPARGKRIVIKSSGRLFFLRTDEIDWVEAAGNYVKLHAGGEEHLLRETMNGIERMLDPDVFFRIHRSRIVNVERIKELQPWFNGEYVVILRNGTKLTLSRSYREKLQARLSATSRAF